MLSTHIWDDLEDERKQDPLVMVNTQVEISEHTKVVGEWVGTPSSRYSVSFALRFKWKYASLDLGTWRFEDGDDNIGFIPAIAITVGSAR